MHKLIDTRDWSEVQPQTSLEYTLLCHVTSAQDDWKFKSWSEIVEKNLNLQDASKPHMRISMKSS